MSLDREEFFGLLLFTSLILSWICMRQIKKSGVKLSYWYNPPKLIWSILSFWGRVAICTNLIIIVIAFVLVFRA